MCLQGAEGLNKTGRVLNVVPGLLVNDRYQQVYDASTDCYIIQSKTEVYF